MNESAQPAISPTVTLKPSFMDYMELTKPRLTALVMLTLIAGYYLGAYGKIFKLHFLHTLIGAAFIVGGTSAFNMFLERRQDRQMERTKERPVASRRLLPVEALVFSGICSLAGFLYLALFVNELTAALAALSALIYLLFYTPLKLRSPLCTYVGAISGAIPPMMGWTAATGRLTLEAWLLFALLFFWQIPHFLAIGWMHRDDYIRAGFKVLPAIDPQGLRTKHWIVFFCLCLIPVSLLFTRFGMSGPFYSAVAVFLGMIYLFTGVLFSVFPDKVYAKRLFIVSLIYLPALLAALVVDRLYL